MIQHKHRLDFLELPDLKDGENITFRLGDRWYNKAEVGDEVLIYQTEIDSNEYEPFARGRITNLETKPFLDIMVHELRKVCCRGGDTAEGLAWNMLECYPNEFNLDSDVTMITFEVMPEPEEAEEGGSE